MVIFGSLALMIVSIFVGLWFGSASVSPGEVFKAFVQFDPTNNDHLIIRHSRVPRILLGVIVGIALGLAGAIMQSLTRNPLADPGILGINAGASAAVVIAIAYFGMTDVSSYLWWAFIGAALAAVVVYMLGGVSKNGASPARLALAGAALAMAIGALTSMVLVSNESAFNQFRYWTVGSLQGRDLDVITAVVPFIVVGVVVSLLLIRSLNAIALGEDSARGLGANIPLIRVGSFLAVVLLAGAATAAAGPIAFIGLAAPHIVRLIVGPDNRKLIPGVLFLSPALLIMADSIGKTAAAPGELQTGIAAAVLGAPVFIALVRSKKVTAL
ncbi:iron-siderophore ABC transporter permease protein [Corynebacterium suranareeae]|uniref:Iron-siderophore ABC transporter permease protein n=2 Tax=Corynebacterium suranareeae TaxID=2506452 RepID=A0A160PP07_9CORY|nr:iron-siderophore ABC transporter permease protein [Corynebacterium suranareeae]